MTDRKELKVYTPTEVAGLLKVNPQTVWKYIREGRLRASKLGRVYRIRETDLELLLDETSTGR